jgi:hypothetical protein
MGEASNSSPEAHVRYGRVGNAEPLYAVRRSDSAAVIVTRNSSGVVRVLPEWPESRVRKVCAQAHQTMLWVSAGAPRA